jgi:hypothetical protein
LALRTHMRVMVISSLSKLVGAGELRPASTPSQSLHARRCFMLPRPTSIPQGFAEQDMFARARPSAG